VSPDRRINLIGCGQLYQHVSVGIVGVVDDAGLWLLAERSLDVSHR